MAMTEYETAYVSWLTADLLFRREQEQASQLRHAEHMAQIEFSTAANRARAVAETKLAEAALAQIDSQKELAAAVAKEPDVRSAILQLAVSRINDRTGTAGTPDIPRAVSEIREVLNEIARQYPRVA